jgi:FixJ family two-component response regulator
VLLSTADIKSRAYASAEEYLASVPLSEPACVMLDNQLPLTTPETVHQTLHPVRRMNCRRSAIRRFQ